MILSVSVLFVSGSSLNCLSKQDKVVACSLACLRLVVSNHLEAVERCIVDAPEVEQICQCFAMQEVLMATYVFAESAASAM